ncbi:MAG: polysulfide reductase NrfD [Coriobacteriales bacterium]|nr:polysulfide reductase NrfD [Coriobacteriales bacterium]
MMHPNKLTRHYWVWPIAWYLFLGGLGGGTLFATTMLQTCGHAICELLGLGDYSGVVAQMFGPALALATFAGVVFLGVGSALLIFELGQWKNFIRVWIASTSIMKWGATFLVLAMVFGFVEFLFFLPPQWNLFWYQWIWLRDVCTALAGLFGFCVAFYTGCLLGTQKSKPFWNTPLLPVLFTVSAVSTATALVTILVGLWPAIDGETPFALQIANQIASPDYANQVVVMVIATVTGGITEVMHKADAVMVILEIILLLVYIICMRASGNLTAKRIAQTWISGSKSLLFWGGMLIVGLGVPLWLYLSEVPNAGLIAPVLILASGLLLRFLVLYSDGRQLIPGEEAYYAKLPKGNEEFLQPWKKPY